MDDDDDDDDDVVVVVVMLSVRTPSQEFCRTKHFLCLSRTKQQTFVKMELMFC
jgi:hypothetical protein